MEKPRIRLPEKKVVMRIGEGETYHGAFSIENELEGEVRGLVYTSSFRMRCSEQGFEGHHVKVHFSYDASGMVPGDIDKGAFTIVCSGGEFELPFTAMIEKPFVMTSVGKVRDIESFRKLAVENYQEAARLFRSRDFCQVLKYEDRRCQNLYHNMRRWSLGEQALEEFLVGTKQKEKLFLTLSGEKREFQNIASSEKTILQVLKNTWGYMQISVETKGEFLCVPKQIFTTEDFRRSRYNLEYIILANKLHDGKNYGEIILRTPYEELVYEVVVTQNPVLNENYAGMVLEYAELIKSYLSLEAGRVTRREWTEDTLKKLANMQEEDPENDVLLLVQAHILMIENKMDAASECLEKYNYSRFALGKKLEIDAYYLYLTAVCKMDETYTDKVVEDIRKMYGRNGNSWEILLLLFDIDSAYKTDEEKLRVLEEQCANGANGLLFYMEAYRCYREQPDFIKKLGAFEVRVFGFAAKYRLLTLEVSLYIANLATQLKGFDKKVYHILSVAYEMYGDVMILNAICRMLIKGHRIDGEYFVWYERAVNEGMKIAQLYESYMLTIHGERMKEPFPKSIYFYFIHSSVLDYTKLAILYANILIHAEVGSELYNQYREKMENFAFAQLGKRHINEQLRVIYNHFLNEENLTPERMEILNEICHTYEVTVQTDRIKSVMVIGADGEVSPRVSVIDRTAKIQLYSSEDRIVWEGIDGNYYVDTIPYESDRLFYETRFLEMCRKAFGEAEDDDETNPKELTFDDLRRMGGKLPEDEEVFAVCSEKIGKDGCAEDDFLTYLCFALFKRGFYDKEILTYLTAYYCGPTREMKLLWRAAKLYDAPTGYLAERILTQMLFAEMMFGEAAIFEDYYKGKAYDRLQWAYLAYVSREYVTKNREIGAGIVEILCEEYRRQGKIPDVCQMALLKYYADEPYDEVKGNLLLTCMRDLCTAQTYFPFFMKYDKEWLKELQLYDKTIVSYQAEAGAKVFFHYQIVRDGEAEKEYVTESVAPMYENVYVKTLVLFEGEKVRFYFEESGIDRERQGEIRECQKLPQTEEIGKYRKINEIIRGGDDEATRRKFCEEEKLADAMFPIY